LTKNLTRNAEENQKNGDREKHFTRISLICVSVYGPRPKDDDPVVKKHKYRDQTDGSEGYISPQICELHVVIKHPAALPGTDGAEGGGAQATNHPLLSYQAPPSTVSVSPDSPPTTNITKFVISQNMSGSQVVEGPPDADTQAPSVVCTPVNMTHTK